MLLSSKNKKGLVPVILGAALLFTTAGFFVGGQIIAESYVLPELALPTGERIENLQQFLWGVWDIVYAEIVIPILLLLFVILFIGFNWLVIRVHARIFSLVKTELKPIVKTLVNLESRFLDIIDLQPEKALKGRKTRLAKRRRASTS